MDEDPLWEHYSDAVQDCELAGVIDTDHRAWGAVVGFGGVADGDGLLGAIENFVMGDQADFVTDAAAALRHFGHDAVADLVERALAEYRAVDGTLGEDRWEAYDEQWKTLTGGDIIDRIGASLGAVE